VRFEYDARKSAANHAKHGIDFIRAQLLWEDRDRIEIPARSTAEPRWQLLGRIGDVVWSAFFTYRENALRIISVRRARDAEKELYENS
jgi:hypothetical protein